MGRTPQPTEVKRRRGNPGKKALPDLKGKPVLDNFDGQAQSVGEAFEQALAIGWWVAQSDAPLVELARHLIADVESGATSWDSAAPKLVQMFSRLGMAPSERVKSGAGEVKPPGQQADLHSLDAFRARQAEGKQA